MTKRKVDHPKTMSEMIRNTKSRSGNLDAFPTQAEPPIQTFTSQLQSHISTTKKKAGRPRTISELLQARQQQPQQPPQQPPHQSFQPSQQPTSQPLFQPPQPPLQPQQLQSTQQQPQEPTFPPKQPTQQPLEHLSSSSPNLGPTASESTTEKRGRGKAIGIKNWGSGVKFAVEFNEKFCPLGTNGTILKGQLGIMVRNGYRVPLTYVNWKSIPDDIKEDIWKEVKDNLEFCPDEFKQVCFQICNKIWKDNKSKIKSDYYTPYMPPNVPVPDPQVSSRVPKYVVPDQWKQLVEYWGVQEVREQAVRNSTNRERRGPPHNTGRKHFANIRNEMAAKGERLDKMGIFIKTRKEDDPDVIEIVEEYDRRVNALPEAERTIEARDRIFHQILGKDDHGYCRTYGGGVPRSSVYKQDTVRSSHATSPLSMDEIQQLIKESVQDVESRLNQQFSIEIDKMRAQMFEYMESRGSDASEQVPDASSGHRVRKESVGDDLSPLDQSHSKTPPSSPLHDEQVCKEVFLQNSGIPKNDVGEGLLITIDPMSEIEGEPLGEGYCKVFVGKAIKPKVHLEKPRRGVITIGDAVGRHVAWRYCDVIEKYPSG